MSMLEQNIKNNKPNLKLNSLNVYKSIINNISKKLNINIQSYDDVNKNFDVIIRHIEEKEPKLKKTYYSGIISLYNDNNNIYVKKIRENMEKSINIYNEKLTNQEMTDKQRENYKDWSEIKKMYNNYKEKYEDLLYKDELNNNEFYQLQLYVLLSCFILSPPVRSLNWTEYKIKNIDKIKDNYREGQNFIFNTYKNSNKKGQSIIKIPINLYNILLIWEDKNKHDYLFVNKKGDKLTPVTLCNLLNNFFNCRISSSMLRHIYINDQYGNIDLKKIWDNAHNMQHDILTNIKYIIKNDKNI